MQKNDFRKTKSLDKYSILISVAFFIVIAYVAFSHHNYWTNGDYIIYSNLGENILSGNGKNVKILNAGLGGPVFYASINSLTGDAFLNAKLISLLAGTGIVAVSYFTIKNIFNAKIALLGQLFVVFTPRIGILSIQTLNEIIPIFLIFSSFFLITKKNINLKHLVVIGILLGLAFTFRYQSGLILIAFVIFFLIRNKKIKQNLLSAGLLVIIFSIVISPMLLYNFQTHGNILDSNSSFEQMVKSKYKPSPENIEKIKQSLVTKNEVEFQGKNELFIKNYLYNLFYHNPNKLFNFDTISNLSLIPTIFLIGLIPVFTGLFYIQKISYNKSNLIVTTIIFFITLISILAFGDIEIHFFALIILPLISITIMNFSRIQNNLLPVLLAPLIYLLFISIIPVSKPEHLLPMWIFIPMLGSVFFIQVFPKVINFLTKRKQNNENQKIIILVLVIIFTINLGHSYKSIENHLYEENFDSISSEFLELFNEQKSKTPTGIEWKMVGDVLSSQPNIENSYVMTGKSIVSHYANSNWIYSGFYEGKDTDTFDEFIHRTNWSQYELYFSDINSHPSNYYDKKSLVPDYLVYFPTKDKQTRDNTLHERLKILSDPTHPEIPKNFKFLYKSEPTGITVYKILH